MTVDGIAVHQCERQGERRALPGTVSDHGVTEYGGLDGNRARGRLPFALVGPRD